MMTHTHTHSLKKKKLSHVHKHAYIKSGDDDDCVILAEKVCQPDVHVLSQLTDAGENFAPRGRGRRGRIQYNRLSMIMNESDESGCNSARIVK